MAFADVYHIEDRLKQVDERIIRIDFDYRKRKHLVIGWDSKEHEEYLAFTVPLGELDCRVEHELYRLRPENYNAFDEIRASEAKKQRDEDQKISDMAHEMGDMLYKPLLKDALGV